MEKSGYETGKEKWGEGEKKTKERSRWEDDGEGKGEGKEGVRAGKVRMKGIRKGR